MDPKTEDRFIKILGMMGSSHEGERQAAAGRAAAIIIKNPSYFMGLVQNRGSSSGYTDYNRGFEDGLRQGRAENASKRDHEREYADQFGETNRQGAGPHPKGYFDKLRWIANTRPVWALLNTWEQRFVEDVYRRQQPLSHKQRAIIDRIMETAKVYGYEYPGDAR